MNTYRIGQILTSKEDIKLEVALSGEKVIIPKGNKVIIGADNLAHHIETEMIQPLPDDCTVGKYDTEGLAEYLYLCLRKRFPMDEMFDDFGVDKETFIKEIEFALDDIGF